MDKPSFGFMRWGYFRWGVVNPNTFEYIGQLKTSGGVAVAVTRYQRSLGETKDCDSQGWWPVSYTSSGVVGVWSHRGGTPVRFAPGTYCEYDAVFYTLDGMSRKDIIVLAGLDVQTYYTVMSVEDKYDEAGGFAFRVCQCKRRPLLKAETL